MEKESGRKLSPAKRIGGFALLIIGAVGGFAIGYGLINLLMESPAKDIQIPPEFFRQFPIPLIPPLLGPAVLLTGIILYFLVLYTNSFTFNFAKPFWTNYKIKFFIINIIVIFLIALGIGFTLSTAVTPMLTRRGLSWPVAFIIPNLFVLLLVTFLSSLISIWAPLKRSIIKKRLLALGVPEEEINKGIYAGISDPVRSSFKKFLFIEDDVGMLWIKPAEIIYRGDSHIFRFSHEQFTAVERVVDSGSLAALGGAVHVIIKFKQDDGRERRLRLHTEGQWTLKQVGRELNSLAAKFEEFRSAFGDPAGGQTKKNVEYRTPNIECRRDAQ